MRHFLMKFIVTSFLALALSGCYPQKPRVFTVTNAKGTTDIRGPEVIGSVNLKVDIEALQNEKNSVVNLPLPDKKSIMVVRRRLDKSEKGHFAWYGIIEKDPGSFVLISITPKAIAGKITTSKGDIYTINYVGKGIHRIDQINGNALPERKDDDIEVPAQGGNEGRERDCPDPATQVDINGGLYGRC